MSKSLCGNHDNVFDEDSQATPIYSRSFILNIENYKPKHRVSRCPSTEVSAQNVLLQKLLLLALPIFIVLLSSAQVLEFSKQQVQRLKQVKPLKLTLKSV